MSNSNCLDGMACPECGAEQPFRIVTTCFAQVTDDGVEDTWEHEWETNSPTKCLSCGLDGTVADFTLGVKERTLTV